MPTVPGGQEQQASTATQDPQQQGQTPDPSQGQDPANGATQQANGQESWIDSLPQEAQAEIRRLRSESASRRTELQTERARREELERGQMTEQQRLQHERDEAIRERDELRSSHLRSQVALDRGLPSTLVDRLRGSTREELEQDADALLREFNVGQPQPGRPAFDAGVRTQSGANGGEPDMSSLIRRAAGRPA